MTSQKRYRSTGIVPSSNMPSSIHRWAVYRCVCNAGASGITRRELTEKCGLWMDRVSFYLSMLMREGYVVVVSAVSVDASYEDAALAALLSLESALVARARVTGATPEMEKGFGKYTKLKELALRPGTAAEGTTALRLALIELVKLVF